MEEEPIGVDQELPVLGIISVLLTPDGKLHVSYRHSLNTRPASLRLAIRTPGEERPRALISLPNQAAGTEKPSNADVMKALDEYKMFAPAELVAMEIELS